MRGRHFAAPVVARLLFFAAALLVCCGTARAGAFIDAAGRRVVLPEQIGRVLPADRNAEVLVFVLAPEKLVGLSQLPGRAGLFPRAGRLPIISWRPRTTPEHMAEMARRLGADLIVDAGPVNPTGAAFANAVQQLTGIPYILVDDSFARMPTMLRSLGANLGAGERSIDLALFAEHTIAGLRGRLLIRPDTTRPHVYYARGRDGLTTALPGSPAGEALDEAGAINVAAGLGRGGEVTVTHEQLLGWNPEVILVEERGFYESLLRNPAWRRLAAVRNKRVYLEPSRPFGWIEDPSGINRLIGLYWLSTLFYPDATQEDLRTMTCDFYGKFYEITLTNAQLEAMVRPAGAPPPETLHPIGEPLVGLGAAPPSSLPSATPGTAAPSPSPSTTQGAAAPSPPSSTAGTPPPAPTNGPSAACTVPGGPTPYAEPTAQVPGLAPPGRRGRGAALAPVAPLETTPPIADFVPPPIPDTPRPERLISTPLAPVPLVPAPLAPASPSAGSSQGGDHDAINRLDVR